MSKQPFTSNGVAAKIEELYALSDSALQGEAAAVKSDLKSWVNKNFTLSVDQFAYLINIKDDWSNTVGNDCCIALLNRLPISLLQPTTNGLDKCSSKIVRTNKRPVIIYNKVTGFTATGELEVELLPHNDRKIIRKTLRESSKRNSLRNSLQL